MKGREVAGMATTKSKKSKKKTLKAASKKGR